MLPCMGSQDQTTARPSRCRARTRAGRWRSTLSWPMRLITVSRPGSLSGLSASHRRRRSSTGMVGPALTPIGLAMPRQNSTCAPSSWRVRSPIHRKWARGVVPAAGGGIDPGHRLLEAQEQGLVRGVEGGAVDLGRGEVGDAAGLHELQRLGDPVRHVAVALALRAAVEEAQGPLVDAGERRVAALGEGAQQVQGGGGLGVGLELAGGVGLRGRRARTRCR